MQKIIENASNVTINIGNANKKQLLKIWENLSQLSSELMVVSSSLYSAEERKDIDFTKPASLCIDRIMGELDECIAQIEGIEDFEF